MSRPTPPIAIIIVTYRRHAELLRLLQSIAAQATPRARYELCVIDNGADAPRVDPLALEVEHWHAADNIGASAGRNLGVAHTSAPLLIFIDDDGVIAPGFLDTMEALFEADAALIAARGRVVPLHHPILSAIPGHYDRGLAPCDELLIIEGATGIRRAAYEVVGGYNEAMFGGEGIELSERLLRAHPDGRIRYEPGCVLRHDFVDSLEQLWRKARRQVYASLEAQPHNETLRAAKQRYASYRFIDARPLPLRIVARVMNKLYAHMQRIHAARLRRERAQR
jgi:glycosyltransferase involved in cell wall biosynthesis